MFFVGAGKWADKVDECVWLEGAGVYAFEAKRHFDDLLGVGWFKLGHQDVTADRVEELCGLLREWWRITSGKRSTRLEITSERDILRATLELQSFKSRSILYRQCSVNFRNLTSTLPLYCK